MRILGVVRLSRTDEASTSVERQRDAIERWSAAYGHEIVAWAVDDGVSGDKAPWQRPELSRYLPRTLGHRDAKAVDVARATSESRAGEWDAIVVWKLDRLGRRAADMLTVVDWCRDTGRKVIETESGQDYTSTAGALTLSVLAGLAQAERAQMVTRAKASFDKLSKVGRHRGGQTPWGYTVDYSGPHPVLVVEEDAAAIIRECARRIVAGESANGICRDLAARGVPTPSGRGQWRVGAFLRAIKSDRMLGYMVREDKRAGAVTREFVVRGDDGMPVARAAAILTRDELSRVRAALEARRAGGSGRIAGARPDRAMLTRVLYCGECLSKHETLEPMYVYSGRNGTRYYRCGSKARTGKTKCSVGAVRKDYADEAIGSMVLKGWGALPVQERRWVAGNDVAETIALITEALETLRDDRAAGLYSGARGTEEYRTKYLALETQREALEANEVVRDHWEAVDTDRTFSDRWAEADDEGSRNDLLRGMGVRFFVNGRGGGRGQSLDTVRGRIWGEPLPDAPNGDDLVSRLSSVVNRDALSTS